MKRSVLIAGLGLAFAFSTACASPFGRADAERKLQQAGYHGIHDLERQHGLWEADVVRKDGSRGEVVLDPTNGEIFDARNGRPLLTALEILDRLQKLGYTSINSTDRDGAIWEVEATDAKGVRVELTVSGYDGRVLHSKRDYDFSLTR